MQVKRSFYTTVTHEIDIERVEEVDCNLCGGARYNTIGNELDFHIRECANCGLVYVSPQPADEELPKLYEGMYRDASEADLRSLGLVEKHIRRIVRNRLPEGGKLFEAGCGFGGFLEAVEGSGFELSATELDPTAAARARERVPGAAVQCAAVDHAEVAPESQDCVVAIAVLEHVKDPRDAHTSLTGLLKKSGVLVVQVPRIAPFIKLKRFVPWLPIYFEAPRHLFDFSPTTLCAYFEELGYRDIRLEVARPYSSNGPVGLALIRTVKLVGLALHALTGGRYIYPFAAAFVIHAVKDVRATRAQPS